LFKNDETAAQKAFAHLVRLAGSLIIHVGDLRESWLNQ
jgi:hypothetical protein